MPLSGPLQYQKLKIESLKIKTKAVMTEPKVVSLNLSSVTDYCVVYFISFTIYNSFLLAAVRSYVNQELGTGGGVNRWYWRR